MRSRDVVCMKKLGEELFAVVAEENCQGKQKPVTEEPCPKLEPCPPEWFNTKWSEVRNFHIKIFSFLCVLLFEHNECQDSFMRQ